MSQKVAHLIGNGPSKAYFKNEPEGDVYGCNFGTPGIKTKANFIHDRRPLMHLLKQEAFWADVCDNTTDTIILRTNYIRISQLLQKKKLLDKEKIIPLPKKIREKTSLEHTARMEKNKKNELRELFHAKLGEKRIIRSTSFSNRTYLPLNTI